MAHGFSLSNRNLETIELVLDRRQASLWMIWGINSRENLVILIEFQGNERKKWIYFLI